MDHYPVSGQTFSSDFGGFNVDVAFCDTNDAADTSPSAYAAPGPNGGPKVVCGGNDDTACGQGYCKADSLVVTSSDSVVCSEYLGPTYIGAGEGTLSFHR